MGTRQRSRRGAAAAAVLGVVTALGAAGCSDDAGDAAAGDETSPSSSPSSPSSSSSSVPSPSGGQSSAAPSEQATSGEGTVLPVRVRGGSVEPRGERVQVAAGEPFTFAIDSDSAGEIHVHSTPDEEIPFPAGRSREELVLDQPGVVEVELHEPTEVTLFQLEVR